MSLGEKIQQLRKTRDMSQEQLAEILFVSRQAVSKWETDQSSPEIDKILAISRVFSISTDELLENNISGNNGSPSIPPGETWKRRSSFRLLKALNFFSNSKIIFMLFSLACFIAIGVCVIVDCAINRQITWAAYPALSVSFGWLIILPLIFRRSFASLCLLTAALMPYLYFLQQITPGEEWFAKLGLPVALTDLIYVWVLYLLHRFIRISIWYKGAISLFLAGVLVSPLINYYAYKFLGTKQPLIDSLINIFSCIVISAVLGIIGFIKKR